MGEVEFLAELGTYLRRQRNHFRHSPGAVSSSMNVVKYYYFTVIMYSVTAHNLSYECNCCQMLVGQVLFGL